MIFSDRITHRPAFFWGTGLFAVSLVMAAAFSMQLLLPTSIAMGGIFGLSLWGLWHVRTSKGAWLSRIMIVIYTAPFTQAWPLLFRDRAICWPPRNYIYTTFCMDGDVYRLLANLGLLGLISLLAGLHLAACLRRRSSETPQTPSPTRYLRTWVFLILLAGAFLFSWVDAPSDTLLTAKGIALDGIAQQNNLNSAYLLSYILLVLLWVDTETIRTPRTKRIRLWILYLSTLFIVFYFQLLRGNRESIGLIFSLAGLYLTEPAWCGITKRKDKLRRWGCCAGTVLILLTMFVLIQRFREDQTFENRNETQQWKKRQEITPKFLNFLKNSPQSTNTSLTNEEVVQFYIDTKRFYPEQTWGACFLTVLSMSRQYQNNTLPLEWGRTYWLYALSLPPGILTRMMGIERPMERDRNPAWWFKDISSGGAHIITTAFVNFRSWGIAVLLMLYGWLIGWTDRCSQGGWIGRFWYGAFFLVCFHWFWYGDMFLIRDAMAFGFLLGAYAIARRLGWATRIDEPATSPDPEASSNTPAL